MALIMPLLVLMVFGMIVFGIQLFRSQSIQAAAREGGRLAAVGSTYTDVAARAFAEQHVAATAAALTVTVTRDATPITGSTVACRDGDTGATVTVVVKVTTPADHALSVPFLGTVGPDFSSKAAFRCE